YDARERTEISPLSLHDALPIWNVGNENGHERSRGGHRRDRGGSPAQSAGARRGAYFLDRESPGRFGDEAGGHRHALRRKDVGSRSEEHTSELQSRENLVCRLLL